MGIFHIYWIIIIKANIQNKNVSCRPTIIMMLHNNFHNVVLTGGCHQWLFIILSCRKWFNQHNLTKWQNNRCSPSSRWTMILFSNPTLLLDFKDKTRPQSCHVPRHAEDREQIQWLCTILPFLTLATIWLLLFSSKWQNFRDVWRTVSRVKRPLILLSAGGWYSYVTPE